jgi:hypothetical protein
VTLSPIYRPTSGEPEHNADEQYEKSLQGGTSNFQPDKGFSGAEGGMYAIGTQNEIFTRGDTS